MQSVLRDLIRMLVSICTYVLVKQVNSVPDASTSSEPKGSLTDALLRALLLALLLALLVRAHQVNRREVQRLLLYY